MDIPFRRQIIWTLKARQGIDAWMNEWMNGVKNLMSAREKSA
jgi:hypothetical protein